MPPFLLTVLKISLLLLLYFFIYRAVRAVVLDLYGSRAARAKPAQRRPKRAPRGRAVPTKVIVVDDRGAKRGAHRLSGTLQIGRAPSCHIRPDDTYISQMHARISERNGSWVVEDLGSTNGTYVNQRKISVPTPIAPGDRIRVGKTTLEVRR